MLVVPFNEIYAVASGIRKIRDVAAPDRLRLISSDLTIEAATRGECSLKHVLKIADYEIEVDRRPVATVVTGDGALRSSGESVDPEGLSVQLGPRPVRVSPNELEAQAAAVELDCAIEVIDVDGDFELHGVSPRAA
jgi:hypothetical protein